MMATLPQLMANLLPFFMYVFFHFNYPFFWWVGIEAFTASILQPWGLNLSIFVQRLSLAWVWTFVSLSCPLVPPEQLLDQGLGICLQIQSQ